MTDFFKSEYWNFKLNIMTLTFFMAFNMVLIALQSGLYEIFVGEIATLARLLSITVALTIFILNIMVNKNDTFFLVLIMVVTAICFVASPLVGSIANSLLALGIFVKYIISLISMWKNWRKS